MLETLRGLLSVRTGDAAEMARSDADQKGAFVTAAALASFPVATAVVTIIWKVLAGLGIALLKGQVGIAAAAVLVGLTLYLLTEVTGGRRAQLGAFLIGVINTILLFAAAVGIDVTFLNGTGGK